MSMLTANVAQEMQQERKPKRPYKARMATKVKWALGDIMERSIDAQRRMRKIWDWMDEARSIADATGDANLLALLGKFDHEIGGLALDVAEMERIAVQARAEARPEQKPKYSGS